MPTITDAATKGDMLPAKGDRPTLQKWQVTLDDGRTAEMLRKPDSDAPTGDVTVEETQWGLRAKIVQSNGYRGGGKDFKADDRGLRGKNASSALHAAVSLVEATNNTVSSDELVALAGKFYEFIESKAKVES
jgi:hypothetical protein